ncbi:MAG: rod shape-determining protein RodA [Cytophagales bacterium]|nr:rod shape-determining protein RodA [Cytophagales bacterium]
MTNTRDQSSDPITIGLFLLLTLIGWVNIYAAEYDPDTSVGIFSLSQSSGKQLLWIGVSLIMGLFVYATDYKLFDSFAYLIYLIVILMLVAVLFFGKEVSGAQSWFQIGSFRLQPSEFAKYATLLAVAKYLSELKQKTLEVRHIIFAAMLFMIPLALTILQRDAGTALVYTSLILVLFREGMSPLVLIFLITVVALFLLTLLVQKTLLLIGIVIFALIILGLTARTAKRIGWVFILTILAVGMVVSVDFAMNEVFQPHQQKRIMSLINPNADPLGVGWNVTQSKIAIGSGGFQGKGFLQGTQTKFDFVPEQTTDFIFCTVGEEHGWLGTFAVIALFCILLIRLINIAERQKAKFARIFGYGVVSVLFFHFLINIAMTIGLFPVIGIPLPFFSYGGSSLLSFSLMLFTFLKLDAHRMQVLQR